MPVKRKTPDRRHRMDLQQRRRLNNLAAELNYWAGRCSVPAAMFAVSSVVSENVRYSAEFVALACRRSKAARPLR